MSVQGYADIFKALSEPVRLRLLFLLSEHRELCVCDLVSALEIPQSVVSRHLAYLRKHELLQTRREGVWVYYRLAKLPAFADELLAVFRKHGAANSALADDLAALKTPLGQCC